jgi:branched-chain amino acid transport system permease protein
MAAPRASAGLRSIDNRILGGVGVGAAAVVMLVITQLVLPGGQGKGTPMAIMFQGLVFGLLNALIAVGIVLIYRSHRIINFAQAALGVGGGVFTANLISLLGWNYFLSFAAGVLVAAGLGLIFQLFFVIRFFNAPRLALTILTIAAVPAIQFATGFISGLPIFPPLQDRTQDQLLGQNIDLPFDSFVFHVGEFNLRFGFAHVFAIAMASIALGALVMFFRYSRMGIAIRAAAENNDRAKMLGISVLALSMVAWTIAGALSGLGVVLSGSIQRQFSPGVIPPELIIVPLAAAVVGRFTSYPLTVAAAVIVTMMREALRFSYQTDVPMIDLGMFVLILVVFLLSRRRAGRSEEAEASSFESAAEQRAIPKEMLEVSGVAFARRAVVVILAIGLIVLPLAATPGQINDAGYLILVTISMLSLIPLTGWAGQASLGQFAFVAVAAVVGGALTSRVGLPFWVALVIVPFFTAAFTVVIGIPALRIRGLFLAVATFAFAIAVQAALFQEKYFDWLLPTSIDRPTLFFFDFEDGRSMYYLDLAALTFAVFLIVVLRRSRPGRVLIGLRDNENNLRSFGIDPTRMRLAAFAISGFLCGLSGVMLAHHNRAVTSGDFSAQLSIDVFLYAVVGGVGSVTGVLLGALYYALQRLITHPLWAFVIGPTGVLLILYVAPGGLAAIVTSIRDGVLKIVAQRRQMIVPALFADIDPAALEHQLIPLAEPIPGAGLQALPVDMRYAAESGLYGTRGAGKEAERSRDEEAKALGAAAEHFGVTQ